jgi:hypothetical protein
MISKNYTVSELSSMLEAVGLCLQEEINGSKLYALDMFPNGDTNDPTE